MKRLVTRRVLNVAAICAVIIGVAVLASINLFAGRSFATRTLTIVVWCFWGAIAVGYVIRLVVIVTDKRRARTKDPLVSAADAVQDLYLGRLHTPEPVRESDEYSAHGSPPPRNGEDDDYSEASSDDVGPVHEGGSSDERPIR